MEYHLLGLGKTLALDQATSRLSITASAALDTTQPNRTPLAIPTSRAEDDSVAIWQRVSLLSH